MGRVKCPVLQRGKHHIYGAVRGVSDIRAINCYIREQIRKAGSRSRITELVRRSLYLYTLTHAPAWKKAFEGKIRRMREVAKEEYERTARTANKRLDELGLGGRRYDEKIG